MRNTKLLAMAGGQIGRYKLKHSPPPVQSENDLKASQDFEFFCSWLTRNKPTPLIPQPHMKPWIDAWVTGEDSKVLKGIAGQNVNILSPRGSAKAQPLDEPVLTPTGWVNMGDLKVGDYVIAVDGTPTQITIITPQGIKPNYRVTFTDGSHTYCSDDHLWTVRNLAGGDPRKYQVLPLNHIRTKVFVSSVGGRYSKPITTYRDATLEETPWLDYRGYAKYHIPITEPVQYTATSDLPIHPYVLGILIGDGCLTNGACFATGDQEIIELINSYLPGEYICKQRGKNPYNYNISKNNVIFGKRNPIVKSLKELGLYGCNSFEKFIPKQYLFASLNDREALLQGLMDSDGTVGKTQNGEAQRGGGQLSFCTISPQLKEDMAELVRSLGGIATFNIPRQETYTVNGEKRKGQVSYKIGIKLNPTIIPFKLTRKLDRYLPCTKLLPTRGIINIEYVNDVEMQCITVDHISQTYITRNHIVTHNSTLLGLFVAWIIGVHASQKIGLKILYISYNLETARAKSAAIKDMIETDEYRAIFPCVRKSERKWSDELWTIDYKYADISGIGEDNYTFKAAGITGSIVSKRCSLVIYDDLIKNADDIGNPEVRTKMERNYSQAILPTLFEGGRMLGVGTRFRGDDIHCTQFIPDKGWHVIEQEAILKEVLEDGTEIEKSYWEDFWSLSYLTAMRLADPLMFMYQYMNKIGQVSSIALSESWIRYGEPPTQFDSMAIGVDLAASQKERSCYSVFTLVGKVGHQFWLLDFRRGRWIGNMEKCREILDLYANWVEPDCFHPSLMDDNLGEYTYHDLTKWTHPNQANRLANANANDPNSSLTSRKKDDKVIFLPNAQNNLVPYIPTPKTPWRIFVEKAAYQISMKGDLQLFLHQQKRLDHIAITPLSLKGDKMGHLISISGGYSSGMVIYNKYVDWKEYNKEFTEFGVAAYCDCVDSAALALKGLGMRQKLDSALDQLQTILGHSNQVG